MVRRVLAFTGFLLLPLLGHAQEIHKCVSADGITYQGVPCPGPEAPAPVTASGATQTARPYGAGRAPGLRAPATVSAAAAVAAGDDLHRDDR